MDPASVLRTIGNKYNAEILRATQTPKSAQNLSNELNIPIATSYRRIEELLDHDLLELKGTEFSEEGRRNKVYRRKIDGIGIKFGQNEIEVKLKRRTEPKSNLVDVWSDLRKEL